jgi:hypothetical protein
MDAEVEDNPGSVIYSSVSGSFLSPFDLKTILERLLPRTRNGEGTSTVFEVLLPAHTSSPKTYSLTVAPIQQTPALSLEDVLERCQAFIYDADSDARSLMTVLARHDIRKEDVTGSQGASLIILSRLESTSTENALPVAKSRQTGEALPTMADIKSPNAPKFWHKWNVQWQKSHKYESLPGARAAVPPQKQHGRRFAKISLLALAVILALLLLAYTTLNGKGDGIYVRYDTSGSTGPRHQLRIYWQNASQWAAANPQDTGKWKVRLDDQAIIPAELYDEDEDRYQQWYRNRYPEVQQVVEDLNYVRPAWLGSLDMMVPWDNQFHFAHCVLALRRYWKAKETGQHVCGRDIDHEHVNHCLEALEKRVLIDGPREEMDPPQYLYWQTRVCF